jgi:hypothetical protein
MERGMNLFLTENTKEINQYIIELFKSIAYVLIMILVLISNKMKLYISLIRSRFRSPIFFQDKSFILFVQKWSIFLYRFILHSQPQRD